MFKIKITNEIEQWRMDTLFTKEPETITWIDSFTDGHFVDVGANIGLYSLYCAWTHPRMRVTAFEPFVGNYERLVENCALNGYGIVTSNVAIGAINGDIKLRCVSDQIGSSGHQVNDADGELCGILTLDGFRTLSREPIHYIKIDTDGNEFDIINAAFQTLSSKDLRSALIEVNDNKKEITAIMRHHGFTTENIFNAMVPHSRERRAKEGINAENIIFTR
jgi:FkbM family methyltransferase